MSLLVPGPVTQHRPMYLGEIYVAIAGGQERPDLPWTPVNFKIGIQYVSPDRYLDPDNPRDLQDLRLTDCCVLVHDNGEPYVLNFGSGPGPIDDEFITQHLPCLVPVLGFEIADELGAVMRGLLEQYDPQQGWIEQDLRFANMVDYNLLFFWLCSIVADHTHTGFSRQQHLQSFLEFWSETEGAVNVPGQLAWYAQNRPAEAGPEQEAHDAEAADFAVLVAAGRKAAEDGLNSLVAV